MYSLATLEDIYQNEQLFCDCPATVNDDGNTVRYSGKYCEGAEVVIFCWLLCGHWCNIICCRIHDSFIAPLSFSSHLSFIIPPKLIHIMHDKQNTIYKKQQLYYPNCSGGGAQKY